MFAYCNNRPVLSCDPTGCIIVFIGQNEEEKEQYERAIAYIRTSETGAALIERLEASDEIFTVIIDKTGVSYYTYTSNTIGFNPLWGFVMEDNISVQSAALLLAHEMGHAAQDLEGRFRVSYTGEIENRELLEADNLARYEKPIAKELGEPIRNYYGAEKDIQIMNNTTHYKIGYVRPWTFYLKFWNWGKPRKVITEYNEA